ncbi:MAG: S8 family peptidase [Acetivibrio sp.]
MSETIKETICEEAIYSEEYEDYIFEYYRKENKIKTVCSQNIDKTTQILYVPIKGESTFSHYEYGYQTVPKLYGLMDISSVEEVGVLKVRRQPYLSLFGEGTLIGIVDTGIDYTHKAFIKGDGTTKITSIWDQTNREGTPPEGFIFGTYYSQEMINEALEAENPQTIVPEMDEVGHGTFLAGIAAGNIEEKDNFTGVAPQAELVIVKLKQAKQNLKQYYCIKEEDIAYSDADIMLGVWHLLEEARKRVKPIAVLIALGSNNGNHCGYLPLSKFIGREAPKPGVDIVLAAGNEGNKGNHYEKKVLDVKESHEAELRIGEKQRGLYFEVWVEAPGLASIELISPLGETTERISLVNSGMKPIRFPLEKTQIYVEYDLVEINARSELIFVRMLDPTPGIWRLRIKNEDDFKTRFNIWLPIENFLDGETYFLDPEPNITVCEPGNVPLSMTITAYDHYNDSLYLSASRGYNNNGYIKPDLAAPGVNVYGPLPNNRYGRMSGTSVAAAHGTGCAALMLEWGIVKKNDPYMQTIRITNYFMRGARRKELVYPNREWGYGEIDLFKVFQELRI